MDAYLARLVGMGRNLDSPDIRAANLAIQGRDCAMLMRHLASLWKDQGGDAPDVYVEAGDLTVAEEKHVVLCQLEDAIRRADVDDIELWLDEAVHQGISVEAERRYCEQLRTTLQELFEDGADVGGGEHGADRAAEEDSTFTECRSTGSAGPEFDTWTSGVSDSQFTGFIDAAEILGEASQVRPLVHASSRSERCQHCD